MTGRVRSLLSIAILIVATFSHLAHAGRSQIENGYLFVPRIDVDGFGALELSFRIAFDDEYFFVLEYANETSLSVANSGTFDPQLMTIDIDEIELDSGELYSARLGLVAQSPIIVFNLLDAVLLNPGSLPQDPGPDAERIERGRLGYETQCANCHELDGSGGTFPALTDNVPLAELIDTIERTMPMGNAGTCVGECAADIAAYILATFVDQSTVAPSFAPKVLHRLNRTEFNNTIQDLLGTSERPADNFPSDDTGYGFDNIATVLSLSPLQVELYEQAAWNLVEELVSVEGSPGVWRFSAQEASCSTGGATAEFWNLWSNGNCVMNVELPSAGTYRLSARLAGQQAGPDLVQAALLVNGLSVQDADVAATSSNFEVIETTTSIGAGLQEIGVAFLNDYYMPDLNQDRNMLVDWFQLEGPLELDTQGNRLLICDPEEIGEQACAQQILQPFLLRAWRRPASDEEIARLYSFVELARTEGDDFNTGITLAVVAALQSPNFIFRVELDADPNATVMHPLTDYELASRLSYFLWSTAPDDELLTLASQGQLQESTVLAQQVDRMLDDPRSSALTENFAGQWLHTRAIADAAPDPATFPDFNESLRASMQMQAEMFFRTFVDEERSMLELLTATDTFIDSNLAAHYGIEGNFGDDPQRVDLGPDTPRRGILGQAGILAVLSYPTRTSPVIRGKWVLSELLCAEPPPPPPGVEGLIEDAVGDGSLADVLAQHRAQPECAVCHDLMDPIGLGLENFDAIGSWRTLDNGRLIDPSGVLYGAGPFSGPASMVDMLAEDPRFPACVTEKLYTYGMGRGPTDYDRPYLDAITQSFIAADHNFRRLVEFIVSSEPFRTRSGASVPATAGDSP